MLHMGRLQAWFAPPRFDDAERTRVARLLNVLLLSLLALLIVAISVRSAVFGLVGHWQVYPVFIIALAGLLIGIRRGYVYSSGVALTAALLAYAGIGALTSGGVDSPTFQLFALTIVLGGLLGRTTVVLGTTVVTLTILCGIAALDFSGHLPPASQTLTSGSVFSGQVTVLLTLGGTMALIVATLQEARSQAEAKETALRVSMGALEESEAQLLRHRDELDHRVRERTEELASANEALRGTLLSLTRAQEQIALSEKMASLGLLVAGIAHELKNPLNFVNNFSELALEFIAEYKSEYPKEDPANKQESPATSVLVEVESNLIRIHDHGVRANRIINAMLMHAREEAVDTTDVDVNTLIHEQAELAHQGFSSRVRGFSVIVQESYDDGVGVLPLPAEKLSGLVINLVTNACQSMHARSARAARDYRPQLEITTRRDPSALVIAFRDNGAGITSAAKRRIFDPFFTTKAPGEGTGLGLSLAYGLIVTDLGGSIDVNSEPDDGAEFIIRIPLAAGAP